MLVEGVKKFRSIIKRIIIHAFSNILLFGQTTLNSLDDKPLYELWRPL